MGPAEEASPKADAHNVLLPLALRAFPSPALSNASLDSPTLQKTLAALASPSPWTPYSAFSDSSAIVPTEPGASKEALVMTPPAEHPGANPFASETGMNVIVGGALAPISNAAPQRPMPKAGPGLRLPSFETIGMSPPCPQHLCLPGADGVAAGVAREHALSEALRSRSDPGRVAIAPFSTPEASNTSEIARIQSPPACAHSQHAPIHQFVQTLTPPAETGDPNWRPSIMTTAMDSVEADAVPAAGQAESSDPSMDAASGAMQSVTIATPAITGERAWLEGAVQAVRQCLFLPI